MLRTQEETVAGIRDVSKRALAAAREAEASIKAFKDASGRTLWEGDVAGQSYSTLEAVSEAKRVLNTLARTGWQRAGLSTFATCGSVLSAVRTVEVSVQAMSNALGELKNENRPFRVGDGPQIVATITGDQIFDAGTAAAGLVQNIETLKAALASFLSYPKDDGVADADEIALVALHAKAASEAESAAQQALTASVEAQGEINALLQTIRNERSTVEAEGSEQRTTLQAIASEIEAAKNRADVATAGLEEHWTRSEDALAQLNSLVTTGSQKHEELGKFSQELAAIQDRLKRAEAKAEEANQRHKGYLENIEKLITQAEKMVSGATVAGLARAFGDERASLDKSMGEAMISFFVGIGSIFLVTILLAAYVFEIPLTIGSIKLSGEGVTAALGDEITIAGVLSRTVILLAPFWLTLFSARRYRNLFDLRQQYSHKYNMAFSVDGFKQQAPKYEQQIAAWVFHVVAEAPVTAKGKAGGMDENPLGRLQDIVKIPGDRFKELLDIVGAAKKGS